MPIYMDLHIVPGVKAKGVAEAHAKDLQVQDEHECKCMTYWVDEQRETVFCLIEAPDKDAVIEMHNKAHGLVPHKIIEVNNRLVESFLGRMYDPADAEITDDGLKVFGDPSFRIILVTKTIDPVLLQNQLGTEKANALLKKQNQLVRKNIVLYGGREVEHDGDGFVVSFSSASKAISCALDIQKEIPGAEAGITGFRIGIDAGEPIEKSNQLFGDTIQLATYLSGVSKKFQIAVTSPVRALVSKDYFQSRNNVFLAITPQDEQLLKLLLNKLEEKWQDSDFDMEEYCQTMTMSKSQLYRKTISLTGLSPNSLLKEFRLEKAKEEMKRNRTTIAQITFESGFTSPSYFTKCFKKKYGLLPMAYLDLLD